MFLTVIGGGACSADEDQTYGVLCDRRQHVPVRGNLWRERGDGAADCHDLRGRKIDRCYDFWVLLQAVEHHDGNISHAGALLLLRAPGNRLDPGWRVFVSKSFLCTK